MNDRIERMRQALAMRDADYNVRPEIEDIGNLLHQYDRLRAELAEYKRLATAEDAAPINAIIHRADTLLAAHQEKANKGGGVLPENPYALLREVKDWLWHVVNSLASECNENASLRAELTKEAANARVVELEAYHTNCTDYINGLLGNMADDDKERVAILARAERAEVELKAMQEALTNIKTNYGPDTVAGTIARAALAPSPAGREG